MKKILLVLFVLIAASFNSIAQSTSFGIKAGVNFSNLSETLSSSSASISTGSLTSFNAGIFADIKFSDFSVQPALMYTGKGGTLSESGDGFTAKETDKLYYLQIPVTVLYHVPVSIGEIYFGLGPYIGYGLSGTFKSTVTFNGQTENTSENAKFGSADGEVKRTDFGGTGQAGVKFKNGFLINLNYDLGLSSLSNNSNDKIKTRVFGVSVGYAF